MNHVAALCQEMIKSKSKREMILQFLNEAEFEEVLRMPRCKERKAELIISLRPFYSWDDLVGSHLPKSTYTMLVLYVYCK